MVQVRLLTQADYPAIVELLSAKSKISNTLADQWDWEKWEKYFLEYMNDTHSRVIGCFDQDVLRAFVVQKYLINMPCWIMVLIGQETADNFLTVGHGPYLNYCLLDAVENAESRGVFDVMYSVPTKWLKTTARTQPTSPVWSRYNVYVDTIIPANTIPEYGIHKFICGDTPKAHDRAIKRCSLKMENRIFDDKYML